MKRILLLSAYHAESHKYWAESLCQQLPDYDWTLLSLPARYFAWRIRGNPLSFMAQFSEQLQGDYDLILATSMVDVATLRGLLPRHAAIPWLVYFHENQFAYPQSQQQQHSLEPQMVNLYAALSANRVLFNSDYNRRSFIDGVEALMAKMPDFKPEQLRQQIESKSQVLSVPLMDSGTATAAAVSGVPKLVWNHRWEYDKQPELLLAFLQQLDKQQTPFRLAIVGQQFRHQPEAFAQIKQLLDSSENLQLEQWGYLDSRDDYQACLAEADVVISTAKHDFQGLAVLEAVQSGCRPLLPDALAYPEWFAADYLYPVEGDLQQQAQAMVERLPDVLMLAVPDVAALTWPVLAEHYKEVLDETIAHYRM